ncbi:MAG TPA: methyltransferase domain-containing protein [Mycobacteriales bacterium]|nr:methyltransferase domain-containing protein [Mycobacteriales bacterium]
MRLRIVTTQEAGAVCSLVAPLSQALGVPVVSGPDPCATHVLVVRAPSPVLADLARGLWDARDDAELLVLARPGLVGVARRLGAWLSLDTGDASSPLHLLTRAAADDVVARGTHLTDAVGTAVTAALGGWRTRDVPVAGATGMPAPRIGLRDVARYWSARNSIEAADYDMRAFASRLPPQRRWQRRRHALTTRLLPAVPGTEVLNVGAGSGKLALDLPGSVSVDVVHAKLRYMRRFAVNRFATASVFHLPFRAASFGCVVCCEVIEHVPMDPSPLAELVRVIRPGGRLIVSTPDYGTPVWPTIEKLYAVAQPHGYADEHISHYTRDSLIAAVESFGLRCVGVERLYGAIVIAAFDRSSSRAV